MVSKVLLLNKSDIIVKEYFEGQLIHKAFQSAFVKLRCNVLLLVLHSIQMILQQLSQLKAPIVDYVQPESKAIKIQSEFASM